MKRKFILQFLSFLLRKLLRNVVEMANRQVNGGKLAEMFEGIKAKVYEVKI